MTDIEKILSIGVTFELKKLFFDEGKKIQISYVKFPGDTTFGEIKDIFKSEEEAINRLLIECKKQAEYYISSYTRLKGSYLEKFNEFDNNLQKYLDKFNILNND